MSIKKSVTKKNYIEVTLDETVLKQLGYDVKYEDKGSEVFQKTYLKKNGEDVTNLDIPATYSYDGEFYKITKIDKNVFYKNSSLRSVTIPNSVTEIGDSAFASCSSLTSVNLSNSLTKLEDNVFSFCSSLKDLVIPNGIIKIGFGAFCECSSLDTITIPDSVTEIDEIAFCGCVSLNSLNIPRTVAKIGKGAFMDVPHIEYYGTATCDPEDEIYWGARTMNKDFSDIFFISNQI